MSLMLMQGEARTVGHDHARTLLEAERPSAFVWGGEPTVHVTGSGRGGRNQEAALAAVRRWRNPTLRPCSSAQAPTASTGPPTLQARG